MRWLIPCISCLHRYPFETCHDISAAILRSHICFWNSKKAILVLLHPLHYPVLWSGGSRGILKQKNWSLTTLWDSLSELIVGTCCESSFSQSEWPTEGLEVPESLVTSSNQKACPFLTDSCSKHCPRTALSGTCKPDSYLTLILSLQPSILTAQSIYSLGTLWSKYTLTKALYICVWKQNSKVLVTNAFRFR